MEHEKQIAEWMHSLRDACEMIEKLPASPEQTALITKVHTPAFQMQNYLLENGRGDLLSK